MQHLVPLSTWHATVVVVAATVIAGRRRGQLLDHVRYHRIGHIPVQHVAHRALVDIVKGHDGVPSRADTHALQYEDPA